MSNRSGQSGPRRDELGRFASSSLSPGQQAIFDAILPALDARVATVKESLTKSLLAEDVGVSKTEVLTLIQDREERLRDEFLQLVDQRINLAVQDITARIDSLNESHPSRSDEKERVRVDANMKKLREEISAETDVKISREADRLLADLNERFERSPKVEAPPRDVEMDHPSGRGVETLPKCEKV